jgi:hypothetical protein
MVLMLVLVLVLVHVPVQALVVVQSARGDDGGAGVIVVGDVVGNSAVWAVVRSPCFLGVRPSLMHVMHCTARPRARQPANSSIHHPDAPPQHHPLQHHRHTAQPHATPPDRQTRGQTQQPHTRAPCCRACRFAHLIYVRSCKRIWTMHASSSPSTKLRRQRQRCVAEAQGRQADRQTGRPAGLTVMMVPTKQA